VQEIYLSLRKPTHDEVPVLLNVTRHQRGALVSNDCAVFPMRQRNELENALLRARTAAEEAMRSKDEFLAVVSHELRAPLTSIVGWVQLLASRRTDPETLARGLETIDRNARLQAKLIDDLLDLARISTGKLRLEPRPAACAPILRSVAEGLSPAADARSIALELQLGGEGPVQADPDRLSQVFWNLLNNAVKFTPEHGQVRVSMAELGHEVEIAVKDSGRGIAPEFLPYVFERFRQAAGSGPERTSGVGLGLAISRHLVELHGGTIQADSPGLGRGATFTVRLPRRSSSAV
jgi:signal transduction histidine kinase